MKIVPKILLLFIVFLLSQSVFAACRSCTNVSRSYDDASGILYAESGGTCTTPMANETCFQSDNTCGMCSGCACLSTNGSGVVSCKNESVAVCATCGAGCVAVPEFSGVSSYLFLMIFSAAIVAFLRWRKGSS